MAKLIKFRLDVEGSEGASCNDGLGAGDVSLGAI